MYFKEIEDFNQGLRNIQIFLFCKNDKAFFISSFWQNYKNNNFSSLQNKYLKNLVYLNRPCHLLFPSHWIQTKRFQILKVRWLLIFKEIYISFHFIFLVTVHNWRFIRRQYGNKNQSCWQTWWCYCRWVQPNKKQIWSLDDVLTKYSLKPQTYHNSLLIF